jgi:16S rRNA (cytosine1402-N4)-methyltransferase
MHQNKNQNKNNPTLHVPVLLEEVLTYLGPLEGESYLDLTAGYGGHASAVLERTREPARAVLVDRDPSAVATLKDKFGSDGAEIRQQDFESASQNLVASGKQFDMIMADLGISSPHLNEVSRGFSLRLDGPLDMRMDQSQELTAEQVVNTWSEADLTDILLRYGEEPHAKKIARFIVDNRPFATTAQLAAVAARAWPGRSRVHPATRTFQAIRIAVNDELGQLERSLPLWQQLLAPGGRLAVISFHSLEDRIVKKFMAEHGGDRYDAEWQILTKHAVTATPHELVSNPRSRSAKLRVAAKINNQKERS